MRTLPAPVTLVSCSVVILVMLAQPRWSQAAFIRDAGFEAQNMNYDWLEINGISFSTVSPHSGDWSAVFGPSMYAGVSQFDIPTVVGQEYDFSFWLKSDGGAPSNFSAAFANNYNALNTQTVLDRVYIPAQGYTYYSFRVTAYELYSSIHFMDEGTRAQGSLFLDDIALTPVPEPSSFALLALGIVAGLFAWRRR